MDVNFETLAYQAGMKILQIVEEDMTVARGVHIPKAVMSFHDGDISIISSPDTGVFVLFEGSKASSSEDKYTQYLDSNRKTTREIVFQSRNAAAEFVRGACGGTGDWK